MSSLTKPAEAVVELIRLHSVGQAAVIVASWVLAELTELEIEEMLDDTIRFTVRSGKRTPSDRLGTLVNEGRFRGWAVAGDDPGSGLLTRAPEAF